MRMQPNPTTAELTAALADLARSVGADTVPTTDHHDRWALYHRALSVPEALAVLRRCAALEPDGAVAEAVVVAALERVDRAERGRWVDLLDDVHRPYAARRMAELALLEDITTGALSTVDDVDDWSDWLQLRAAATAPASPILDALAERGRTKRIRRQAAERRT
ncbi:hypothetical protein ACQPW3_19900 [Actinosynnema sp. CA-248983]